MFRLGCRTLPDDVPQLQYETFEQLYDYCYHVASVVGLVCIRIFGYRDPRAEKLAEKVGVAFQLTNILRDVKEDAGLGRVYLPREDFARFGIDLHALTNGSAPTAMRPLLEFEAQRAREFYRGRAGIAAADRRRQPARAVDAGGNLSPAAGEDCRAQLRRLFASGCRLSTAEKLSVMAKGFWRRT